MRSPAKILIQAIGNPLRSDDAVGPLLIERLSDETLYRFDSAIELEWVYQLQIENAEQWRHYEWVILIDADASATEPLSWRELLSLKDSVVEPFDSHQKSPESVSASCNSVLKPLLLRFQHVCLFWGFKLRFLKLASI